MRINEGDPAALGSRDRHLQAHWIRLLSKLELFVDARGSFTDPMRGCGRPLLGWVARGVAAHRDARASGVGVHDLVAVSE